MSVITVLFVFQLSVGIRGGLTNHHTEICHGVHFNQTINVDDPTCGPPRVLHLPNKRCLGICPNVFEPNLSSGQNDISNKCRMCKPVLLHVTLKLGCWSGKYKSIRVTQVTDCRCEDIDCECPTRYTP